jgi:hypothetical protein
MMEVQNLRTHLLGSASADPPDRLVACVERGLHRRYVGGGASVLRRRSPQEATVRLRRDPSAGRTAWCRHASS